MALADPPAGKEDQHRQQVQDLSSREAELARRLQQAGVLDDQARAWLDLDQLRRRLPDGAVFLDVVRLEVFNFEQGKRDPARYVVWVMGGKGEVHVVDLGPAAKIEAAVAETRQALEKAPQEILQNGEPEAEKILRQRLQPLAELVLTPLRPFVRDRARWIVSPDGALWLIPWEILPVSETAYAVEKYRISYVVSGRDLLAQSQGRASRAPGPALMLADPDFDLAASDARQEVEQMVHLAPPILRQRSLSSAFRHGGFKRLPGTAAEARAVLPSLRAWTGAEPRLYLGSKALEGVVKAAHRPRVLSLATHGFFLPDQESDSEKKAPGGLLENPLLRSGLLLAGCNVPVEDIPEGLDDGVLTALEVAGLDLDGTELVVLSACETGLGQVRNGEGVAGLRQAFERAGARAVLASLWSVADRESAQLMAGFFDNLAQGQGKAEALRQAQLKMIAARRQAQAAAHPFFWAAFTLTGGTTN